MKGGVSPRSQTVGGLRGEVVLVVAAGRFMCGENVEE
jgi:hypothetical protein